MFVQEKFLGASVTNWNSTLGWGGQLSSIKIGLVEDYKQNDVFQKPTVGSPVIFQYSGWIFRGIVQSFTKNISQEGNPLYEVDITDPRDLLSGIKLILNNYTGPTFGVPNLYNIYGDLEARFGFGGSQINSSGIPWKLVRDSLLNLLNSQPILLRNFGYRLNLLSLPNVPDYYRIGGNHISVMEFIEDICSVGGCDFFVTLETGGMIKIHTVNRKLIPLPNKIQAFADSLQGQYSNISVGEELRNEVVSKFVVGHPVDNLFVQEYDADEAHNDNDIDDITTFYDETIWPFWGLQPNGNVVIGQGHFDDTSTYENISEDDTPVWDYIIDDDGNPSKAHFFDIDIRAVRSPVYPIMYPTDTDEMRAVLGDRKTWEQFLYLMNDKPGPHFGKHDKLKLNAFFNPRIFAEAILDMVPAAAAAPGRLHREELNLIERQNDALYEHLHEFAINNYGRRFMVRIPFVLVKQEPETEIIQTNQEPTDTGFLDELEWNNAIINRLMPLDTNKLTNEQNKFFAYVRIKNGFSAIIRSTEEIMIDSPLDLTALNPLDYAIGHINWSERTTEEQPTYRIKRRGVADLFIRVQVEPGIFYLNQATFAGPRVVITLPVPITHYKPYELYDNTGEEIPNPEDWLIVQHLLSLGYTKTQIRNQLSIFGSEMLKYTVLNRAVLPDLAVVPLRNNTQCYGPWFAVGSQGQVEFEQDETLTPWNYGGYAQMNLVGESKVQEALTKQQTGESGSITFPNVPQVQLGSALIEGGPRVTDVNVNISEQGATTTYRMQTWTPQFGMLAKYNIERLERLNNTQLQYRRMFREMFNPLNPITQERNNLNRFREQIIPPHRRFASSSLFMVADILEGEQQQSVNAVICPSYDIINKMHNGYAKKALMSLDGLFRPFSIDKDNEDFAHFEKHGFFDGDTAGEGGVNSDKINPFSGSHDIVAMTHGSETPEDFSVYGRDDIEDYRGMGLRFPHVGIGWGYDIYGHPVPGINTEDFIENYKQKYSEWKAGPVDLRWDTIRKVWTCSKPISVKVLDVLHPGGDAILALPMYYNDTATFLDSGLDKWGNYSLTVSVRDTQHKAFADEGEFLWVIEHEGGFFEPLQEYGLTRPARNEQLLSPNQSGEFTIYNSFEATLTKVIAHYDWMTSGQDLAALSDCLIQYFPAERRWRVIGAEC